MTLLLITSCDNEQPTDTVLSESILGKWTASSKSSKYVGEYHRNGKFEGHAIFLNPDGSSEKSTYSDTWYIKGAHLYMVPAKDYGTPEMNQTAIDKVESITSEKMVLISPSGKRLVRYRVLYVNKCEQ